MTTQSKISNIYLLGSWPTGVKEELQCFLDSGLSVSCQSESKAAMPWADIASVVSALTAVVTVALALWDRRNQTQKQDEIDLKALEKSIREKGIFATNISKVSPLESGQSFTIEIVEKTTSVTYKYQATIHPKESEITISQK